MLSAQFIVCKTIFRSFTVAALFASLLLAQPAKDRTVVLISLDGFPAFALEDPKASVPTLRKLAREGSFAPRMKGTNPTVTWPAHTTMITGVPPAQHRVLYNGMLFRDGTDKPPKVVQWRPKTEMVKAPTVYDLAYQAGLTTAEADWVAVYEAPTITYPFPEIPSVNGKIEKGRALAEIIAQTDSEIEVFVPAGAVTGPVRVTTGDKSSNDFVFYTRFHPDTVLLIEGSGSKPGSSSGPPSCERCQRLRSRL